MRITIVVLLFFFTSVYANGQINAGIRDSVYSTILKEQRQLMIYMPKEAIERKDTSMRYPVMYVLDGNAHFLSVAGMLDQLSDQSGNAVLPKMVVVCILNTNRTRDLTPYKVKAGGFLPEAMANETGGGEIFARCIKEEIFPHIAAKYPVTDYRALVGHSFGGIFALNILARHKEMFEDYIVIDPSTWYDERKFARGVLDSLAKSDYEGKSVFIAIANTNNQPDTAKVKLLKTDFSEHEKSIIDFCNKAKIMKRSGLNFSYSYYPNDDHNSVPMIATYDGLRKIFKEYRFSYDALYDPGFSPGTYIPDFYTRLSKKVKHPMQPAPELFELCDLYYSVNKDEKRREETRQLYKQFYPEKAKAFIAAGAK
jgi:predicted alpha/beta superfamily hydrolase